MLQRGVADCPRGDPGWEAGFRSTKAYVGMRTHTYHTRSRAWASQHHIGTSRVHWSPSAFPLSGRTHHSRWGAPSILSPPTRQVCTYPSLAEVLGLLCYHPTARAHKCSNPKIYINLSGTADYGYITHPKSLKRRY